MKWVRSFRLTVGLWRRKATNFCPAGRTGFEQPNQRHFCSTRPVSQTTLDPSEVKKFQSLSRRWWDEQGEFAALHTMNDLRVPFVRDNLLSLHSSHRPGKPLTGLRILDVGCGGGLLTEPLARLGAQVLGIDPVNDSILTARLHSSRDPELSSRLRYLTCTLEELSAGGEAEPGERQFDAVVASEVVEHLADLDAFACCCGTVLKPGGSVFITTISQTTMSYLLGIVMAEQVLRIVPGGMHEWEKFITPTELERLLESNGFSVQSVQGMLYNPLSGSWSWTSSTAVNYALHAIRMRDGPQTDGAHS
ncbi:ubiquinone biosynthesis O-methyltransferase, mitochondrial [Thalassophryne amazonica]|uniref:ubiquinone biosynthesis O-methyltransferase, mitochondrial n=1 Tax=Thalassophryne amazonica TaxID=390379 RepID=UPI001471C655|nr:ubiquinone biosynthesis O-methyltransferase, mitochondrial [Thalassophryne amazonica]